MAGDRERELVVEVLRDASTRGQLSVNEFDQRWEYLRTARTVGELVPLVSDLPNIPPPAERPVGRRRRVIEPPPDAVPLPPTPQPWPDPPEMPGTAMLPFEEPGWSESGPGARRAYDRNARHQPTPFRPDPESVPTDASAIGVDEAGSTADASTAAARASATGEPQGARRSAEARVTQVSAAEEWNTSLRALASSFALLIVSLLVAVVLS